jgi:hypothetical protein
LDFKFTLYKIDINGVRLVGLEVSALESGLYEFCPKLVAVKQNI